MASVIVVGRRSRREHPLSEAVTVVGRDAGAGLELGDLQVSRRHALLVRARQGFFIKDLGSRNGVLLNQERVPSREQALLKNGDVLSVGRTTLIFKELADLPSEDGPPTPTILAAQVVQPAAEELTPAPTPEPAPVERAAPQAQAQAQAQVQPQPPAPRPQPKAPAPRAESHRRRAPSAPSVDALAIQTLIERTERDRQFFRNLSLVLFCLLIATLVLLFAYALLQRNEPEGSKVEAKPPPSESEQALAGAHDAGAFGQRVQPILASRCASCHSVSGKGGNLLIASSQDPSTVADNLAAVSAFLTPGAPERSPLLLKPLSPDEGGLEHGGGAVLHMASPEWRILRGWVVGLSSAEPELANPQARILAPTTAGCKQSVAFRGGESQSGAGGDLAYRWTLIEAPAESKAGIKDPRAETAVLVPDVEGRYAVMLTVKEGEGKDSSTHVLDVRAPRSAPAAEAPEPAARRPAAPAIAATGLERTTRVLLGRAPSAADQAASKRGVAALRKHLLGEDELYTRWWKLELDHLGLTGEHQPTGEPWSSLPAKLRSGRFSVIDVYYALLVGQDWLERYPDSERSVTTLLEKLLGADAARDEALKRSALRLMEGHSATVLGVRAEGSVGLVRAVVRSKQAAAHLLRRSFYRLRGKELSAQRAEELSERFARDPASYFEQLVSWAMPPA